MKVLAVSEDAARRVWVSRALGPTWTFVEASNGREALSMVESDDEIDLVVADETAEPYGAFGLSRECKLLIDPPAVIVLLERAQDVWLARWSGADRWFVRPLDVFELADAATEVVSPAASRRR